VGCGVGAGIEIAWQMLVEGKSLACVDWLDVAMSALEGCVGGMGSSKLAKLLKKWFGCNSFTADTLVHTENGLKPISEIKVGDKVLSYDERTETTRYQPVMAVIQGEQRYQLILITLDSGESIEATAEHPFYINGKGWNPANSLKVGQALQLHNGTTVVIKEIDTSVRLEKVYNITVANTHNYFVGVDGVLVHNADKCYDDIIQKIMDYLGEGFKAKKTDHGSDLILTSEDGRKQIRFDISNPHGDEPHVNIEGFEPRNLYPGDKKWKKTGNKHAYPKK